MLNAGCGAGHLVEMLARSVADDGLALGIDVSGDQIAAAREIHADLPCAEFAQGDLSALDQDDASFDAVACVHTLEYVDDVDGALDEIRRVLKPGGRVALMSVLWDTFSIHGAEEGLNGRILEAWRAHCVHQMLPAEMAVLLHRRARAHHGRGCVTCRVAEAQHCR